MREILCNPSSVLLQAPENRRRWGSYHPFAKSAWLVEHRSHPRIFNRAARRCCSPGRSCSPLVCCWCWVSAERRRKRHLRSQCNSASGPMIRSAATLATAKIGAHATAAWVITARQALSVSSLCRRVLRRVPPLAPPTTRRHARTPPARLRASTTRHASRTGSPAPRSNLPTGTCSRMLRPRGPGCAIAGARCVLPLLCLCSVCQPLSSSASVQVNCTSASASSEWVAVYYETSASCTTSEYVITAAGSSTSCTAATGYPASVIVNCLVRHQAPTRSFCFSIIPMSHPARRCVCSCWVAVRLRVRAPPAWVA
jgi:hypothetical protein